MKTDNISNPLMFQALWFNNNAVHLIATWCCAVVSRIYDHRILSILHDLNAQFPPVFTGVWLFGCGVQVVVTVIALTKVREFARLGLCILYGYWLCVIVSLTACLLYQSNILVR